MAISYPVPEDSRWATWSISLAEIKKHNAKWPRSDGMEIVDQNPDIVPLLEVDVTPPVDGVDYDSATHRIERGTPVVDVPNNQHLHGWEIIELTQEELDARAERTANTVEDALWKSRYDVFDGATGTNTQIQKAIAHLIKKVHFL
jgi:hypothetical protein